MPDSNETRFDETTFGRVGFRRIVSNGHEGSSFGGATFRGVADFSGSQLLGGGATFDGAEFLDRASFVRAEFSTDHADRPAASFDTVDAAADIDLSSTHFAFVDPKHKRRASQSIASFTNLVAQGTLSLRDASFAAEPLVMDGIAAHGIVLDVDEVENVQRDKKQVLELIQRAARDRGDLGMANDADYRLHVLRSHGYSTPVRVADIVGYRWIAGYFVRPQNPLLALAVLVVCLAAVRAVARARDRRRAARRAFAKTPALAPHRLPRTSVPKCLWHGLLLYSGALSDTLSLIGPRRVELPAGGSRLLRLAEATACRVLLVCVVIGLANSNPTLRQFVDTFT
jgi:hypothetical protein